MIKQIILYITNFIRFLFLLASIVMMLFPFGAVAIYFIALNDVNLNAALSSAEYPWSLFSTPKELFMFAGIVFFVGLITFVVSYYLKKFTAYLRK